MERDQAQFASPVFCNSANCHESIPSATVSSRRLEFKLVHFQNTQSQDLICLLCLEMKMLKYYDFLREA